MIFDEQRVALSTHVGGWSDARLTADLESELGIPCIMDNDANVGALGEANSAPEKVRSVFLHDHFHGIGGGLISDGKVYRGADSYAGEIAY